MKQCQLERFFNSLIGTNVRETLFENFSRTTVYVIEDQIKETITNFEPRVTNLNVEVKGRPDDNELEIKVLFDINGLAAATQSFTFILEPTR